MSVSQETQNALNRLVKAPTGIDGLDEITGGGLPKGRPTLICGTAGCGKTLLSMEFLIHGAEDYDEPGVFVAFEESAEELTQNVASLGYDLNDLQARNRLALDYIHIDRAEIQVAGEYDLEALFIRLAYAIKRIGAKRIVLDTLEALFSAFDNEFILRAELRRLFRWLKDQGVSAIITAERGDGQLTRHGLEEYVSDCVILLDHRVFDQTSTRRLRIVKYRGTAHGTNEYPFLIDEDGFSVLPVTSLELDHEVNNERISTGVDGLNAMLGGDGFYRGSSVLISGTAGTGKTSLASRFANAVCASGERCLYLAYEESPRQIIRNGRSTSLDLQPWVDSGQLQFIATRPTFHGLEMHLALIHKVVKAFKPHAVIVDPITNFSSTGTLNDVKIMLLRLVDFLKAEGVTLLMTSLNSVSEALETTDMGISSLIDTWVMLRDIELNGERNRGIYVLKSRGMAHSNQLREFLITSDGIDLVDVYLGPDGVLTGSSRVAQESQLRKAESQRQEAIETKRLELESRRKAVEAQILALNAELELETAALARFVRQQAVEADLAEDAKARLAKSRNTALDED